MKECGERHHLDMADYDRSATSSTALYIRHRCTVTVSLEMTRNEDPNATTSHELQHSTSQDQAADSSDGQGQADTQQQHDKRRAMALVGSALSQLPIWGICLLIPASAQYSQAQDSL
jgi:hypothetical protein